MLTRKTGKREFSVTVERDEDGYYPTLEKQQSAAALQKLRQLDPI